MVGVKISPKKCKIAMALAGHHRPVRFFRTQNSVTVGGLVCCMFTTSIPQIFKNFRYVIGSKLTRDRWQAIRSPLSTLI